MNMFDRKQLSVYLTMVLEILGPKLLPPSTMNLSVLGEQASYVEQELHGTGFQWAINHAVE